MLCCFCNQKPLKGSFNQRLKQTPPKKNKQTNKNKKTTGKYEVHKKLAGEKTERER